MDGIPALDIWNLVKAVFHTSQNKLNKTQDLSVQGNLLHNTTIIQARPKPNKGSKSCLVEREVFRFGAMLYIFEDNEAVIDMIIKGRSPTMETCIQKINLDPKIQIKYIDTKNQLADILTKGNFTRDEWNNLLDLYNINHFSSLCCAQNFSLTSCTKTMANRMQEQEGDNRIVAKSNPTTMNLAFTFSTSS